MNKFIKRSFAQTLEKLLLADERVPKKNGKVVVSLAAPKIPTNQPTLLRWLSGQSDDPVKGNADKLCKFFGVTRDQLVGREPIAWIDTGAFVDGLDKLDEGGPPKLAEIINEVLRQDRAAQDLFIRMYLAAKKTYEDMRPIQYEGSIHRTFEAPQPKTQKRKEKK